MEDTRTFEVVQEGKRFVTILRLDGYTMYRLYSKNKKSANRKGTDYVNGDRQPRKVVYTTRYGRIMQMMDDYEKREMFKKENGIL